MADETDNSASDNAGMDKAVGAIGALLDNNLIESGDGNYTDKQLREMRAMRESAKAEPKKKPPKEAVSKTVTQPKAESEEEEAEPEPEDTGGDEGEREASDEEDADASEGGQEPAPLKLKDIAAKAGVKAEAFDDLLIPTKVNGVEGEVTLAELRKSYQHDSAIQQKAQRLHQEREAFARSQSEKDTETRRVLGITAKVMQTLEQRFVGQRPDERYRVENGDDAFAREDALWRRRKEEHDGEVGRVLDLIREENRKLADNAERYKREHQSKLRQMLPDYFDAKKGPEKHRQLAEFLTEMGITPAEMETMHDSRIVRIADLAMQGYALKTGKPLEAKKVKSSTKPIRTAVADEPEETRRTGTQYLRTKFRRSGGRDLNQAAQILSRMGLGSAR